MTVKTLDLKNLGMTLKVLDLQMIRKPLFKKEKTKKQQRRSSRTISILFVTLE